jgi:hypothetical protein
MKKNTLVLILSIYGASVTLLISAFGLLAAVSSFKTEKAFSYPAEYDRVKTVIVSGKGARIPAVDIILKEGERAYLQFSVSAGGTQVDGASQYLFDRDVIDVEYLRRGAVITALKTGTTKLQTVKDNEVSNFADITVRNEND